MIKLQNNQLTRDLIPPFLIGLAPESLLDLSWTDPALGVQDSKWLPEVGQSPALQQYQRYGEETLTLGDNVVIVTRAVVPWSAEEITADRAAKIAAAWERIKAERDRRKFAGVKVGADWFHCDTDSRGQWERMVNRVNAQEFADSAGYTIGGQPVPWKTMTGNFVVLTAGKIRAVVDAMELQEAVIFGTAEAHRVAMEASATPETYDFSDGWPTVFVE